MVVGFTSDWLYTPEQNRCIAESLQKTGKDASYIEIDHDYGHDSFLLKSREFLRLIRLYLEGADEEEINRQITTKSQIAITRSDVKKEADLKIIGDWVSFMRRCSTLDAEEAFFWSICGRTKMLWDLVWIIILKKPRHVFLVVYQFFRVIF